MGLKEQMQSDIDNVFLSLDEFGERVTVDGLEVTAIFDEENFIKQSLADGVSLRQAKLTVRASDLPGRPFPESRMNVNGEEWYVASSPDYLGLLVIGLERNTQ